MWMDVKDLKPCKARIHGFNSAASQLMGYVVLPVKLGSDDCTRVWMLPFLIMDVESPYNAFLRQSALTEFRAAVTLWCLTLKFPTDDGVRVVHGDQAAGRACYVVELRESS